MHNDNAGQGSSLGPRYVLRFMNQMDAEDQQVTCYLGEIPAKLKEIERSGANLTSIQPELEAGSATKGLSFSMLAPEYHGERSVALDGLKKSDGVKVRYDLIPALAELEIAKVMTIGAMKYDAEREDVQNWMHPSRTHRMMFSASRRHQEARRMGEILDSGPGATGCHHLAAAIVDLLLILEADLRGWSDKDNLDPLCLNRPGV